MLGVHAHAQHDTSRTSARGSCGRHRRSLLRPRSTHTPAMPSDATGGELRARIHARACSCLHPQRRIRTQHLSHTLSVWHTCAHTRTCTCTQPDRPLHTHRRDTTGTHTQLPTFTRTHMKTHRHTKEHALILTHTHIHTLVCMCDTHMHTHATHVRTHSCLHTHIHTCAHTHTQKNMRSFKHIHKHTHFALGIFELGIYGI